MILVKVTYGLFPLLCKDTERKRYIPHEFIIGKLRLIENG